MYAEKKFFALGVPVNGKIAKYSCAPKKHMIRKIPKYCVYGAPGHRNGRLLGSIFWALSPRRKRTWDTKMSSQLQKVATPTYEKLLVSGPQPTVADHGATNQGIPLPDLRTKRTPVSTCCRGSDTSSHLPEYR